MWRDVGFTALVFIMGVMGQGVSGGVTYSSSINSPSLLGLVPMTHTIELAIM